jgi:peroxiredoxin
MAVRDTSACRPPILRNIVAAVTLLLLCGCHSGRQSAWLGAAAPNFTVKDSDRTVTLSQFKGQIVVLNFWATYCAPCVEELPSLVQMQQRMRPNGVTVLAVSLDDDENSYHQFLKEHNVNLLTVRDPDQKSARLFGTARIPESYIIDRKGVVRRKFFGAVDWSAPDTMAYLAKF